MANSLPSPSLQLQKKAPTAFRIIPAGAFSANDHRNNGKWFLSEANARIIIALANQRRDDYLIDYEHQSLNGQVAPAAGWFKKLEWRSDGVYVLDARWSPRAKALIEADEYRYISPVFSYAEDTGIVISLHSIALTNTPALSGLTDLSIAAAKKSYKQMTVSDMPLIEGSERSKSHFNDVFGHFFK